MKAIAVIGANFGDEGKGITTARLSKDLNNAINIRYNSGCGAGHTVETRDGFRHVFGHIGSAAVNNIPTFLSEYFVSCPHLFKKEYEELKQKIQIPDIYVHPESQVTLNWDILLNQEKERQRGSCRLGSTGVGLHETIVRGNEVKIYAKDLQSITEKELKQLRDTYYTPKLEHITFYPGVLTSDDFITKQIESFRYFKENTILFNTTYLKRFDTLVFEGAQGLLLDEDHEWFPYVTHSKTGMCNIQKILNEVPVDNLEINYVTRCYLTRHGPGPFPTEADISKYITVLDETNKFNEFQRNLRIGHIDLPYMYKMIKHDLKDCTHSATNIKLHVTCMDQINNINLNADYRSRFDMIGQYFGGTTNYRYNKYL